MLDGANMMEPIQNPAREGYWLPAELALRSVLENAMYTTTIQQCYARGSVLRADAFGR